MVLYEGGFSGILWPWRHLVPLKKEFGNMGEVVARYATCCSRGSDCAYEEVALNPRFSYARFVPARRSDRFCR